ncbi:MAG: DNA polymerase I [Planctomycetia bacterium]|nr:DNA polymerase I [Planctomycetia bacterium]
MTDIQLSLFDDEPVSPRAPEENAPDTPPIHSPEKKRVFVVDAYGLVYQVFHALPEMHGRSGESVNAVFGFLRDLFFILEQLHPDLLFCAFDLHAPTFRHEMYPDYKIQREKMPEDLITQIPRIRELLDKIGIPVLALEGYEADDILATVATRTEAEGGECYLVTSDKDARQLLSDHTFLYSLRRGKVLDRAFLQEDWGIAPEQVVDYQALVGDSSDNVPGIALIGPKIAKELIQRFGTLDEILKPENLEAFFGKKTTRRKQNLEEGRKTALLCRELVRLKRDVPLEIDWSRGDVTRFRYLDALPIFQEYAFQTLTGKAKALAGGKDRTSAVTPQKTDVSQRTLPDFTNMPHVEIPTFPGMFSEKETAEPLFVEGGADELLRWKEKLENPLLPKVGYDLKQRFKQCWKLGIRPAGPMFDVKIAAYMLYPGSNTYDWPELCELFPDAVPTDWQPPQTEMQAALFAEEPSETSDKKKKKNPPPHPGTYPDFRRLMLKTLYPLLRKRLREAHLEEVCYRLEFPLMEVLAGMEYSGIYLETSRLAALQKRYVEEIAVAREELYAMIPRDEGETGEVNLNSPIQLRKILFEKLQLVPIRKTKTGQSTDAQTLEELATKHPFPQKLLEYRQKVKLLNTYIDALPKLVGPDMRIHTSYNQAVAATGRLSSSDPNLQNIPVRTEEGREIRNAFVSHPAHWKFVSADYSQIELRVLAHYCGDENLRHAFANDEDIHTRVAGQIFGTEPANVEKWMRRVAKTVNFGVIYGQSAFGLSKQLNIPQDEAQRFIQTYFLQFPGIPDFLNSVLEQARRQGFVTTLLGRHRAIEGIRTERKGQLNSAERMAVNTVIQGSAADIIKLAMLKIHEKLREKQLQTRMLLQIHDELLLESPPEEVETVCELLQNEMTTAWKLDVPLKIDAEVATQWN